MVKKLNILYFVILPLLGISQNCDNIIFKDGTEISAIVEEIRLNEISYKKCENIGGPTYVASKSEIFMIRYKNGTKEVMNQVNTKNNTNSNMNVNSESTTASIRYFSELTDVEKNNLLDSQKCFKVVPKPTKGIEFNASIAVIKKITISFEYCGKSGGEQMNYIYIDYLESENGERIYFNKD